MSKKLLFNFNREVVQDYTYIKYSGTIITATNTLEKPIKGAILKGSTKYRDIDTGEVLDAFEDGRNLELVSVKTPVLTTSNEDGTKTNILTVNEPIELRGIGDVKDELDCLTGEVTQRIGEVILNGETTANGYASVDGYIGDYATHISKLVDGKNEKLYFQGFVGNLGNSKDYILTNGFAQYKGLYEPGSYSELEEGLYRYSGADHAYICISASRFTEHTFEGVKKFLKENPQSYLVTNKGSTVKTVDLSILDQNENKVSSISSFNDTTHITASSETIPPIFEGYLATKEVE